MGKPYLLVAFQYLNRAHKIDSERFHQSCRFVGWEVMASNGKENQKEKKLDLDWIFERHILPQGWLSIGTGC